MGTSRQTPPSSELKIFSDRLNKAIIFKKIDIAVLAKELKFAPADIKKMMAGMREPSMKKLIILANALGCSVDYLLGLTPESPRASVIVAADTDAPKPQSDEPARTSGQTGQLFAMVPEMFESDIELLVYIAGFLIERKEKKLAGFIQTVAASARKEPEKITPACPSIGIPSDDGFEDDDLWDGVDDDFEADDLDGEDFEDDVSFDDEDFD